MKTHICAKKLPLVLAIGIATQTWADSSAVEGQKVQVWGTQISNASTMLSDDIEIKQADHLSDLLRNQAGVDIGGAHSLNQRINIRGMEDYDLDITIDGAKQNNNVYHHMGNLLINADILKAVDLQVGTNSVLTGGLSGGIAFETKDAKDLLRDGQQIGARISTGYASNDYHNYSVTAYGQLNDQLDAIVYFNDVNRDNPEDGAGVESVGNDGDIKNGLVKFGLDINESNRIELSYDKYTDEGDYAPRADMGASTNSSITGTTVYPTEFERQTITLGYELDLGDMLNLRATVYENDMNLWRDEDDNTFATYRYREGEANHRGVNVLAESVISGEELTHNVRYGFEVYRQKTKLQDDSVTVNTEQAKSYAAYIEDEIEFSNGLALTPGVRYNRYKLDTAVSDETFTETTFGLNAVYPLTDAWSVRASATELFQGPNLSEVFVPASTVENNELKPETGLNSEIGITFEDRQRFGLDRLNFALTIFRTDVDDYIDDGSNALQNIGDYRIQGFETSLGLSKGNFDARFTYAHSESANDVTDEPLGRQVGDSISLGLDYHMPAQDLAVNWTSLVTIKEEHFDKPSYDVHNISARWTPKQVDGLNVTFGVENIFDEYYTSHASRIGDANHPVFGALHLNDYEPGRNFKLTAAYTF
ncbi:TonB-dependent receptor domain-containing protein [Neptuniibacter sp. QD48_11]|uniref:TonB-dependent receptor domain-containing protein n=1 Tax=unclassified Neptuniibacter TaxID=2630693 RepID=UPI0039F4D6A6